MNNLEFQAGDKVVLAEGPYQGTPGVFLRLREDVHWAEIKEWNGAIRRHPVRWLRHASAPDTGPRAHAEVQ